MAYCVYLLPLMNMSMCASKKINNVIAVHTLPTAEIISDKNGQALVSMIHT